MLCLFTCVLFIAEADVLKEVDPAFTLLKYDKEKHAVLVMDIIQELKKKKEPANPILRWLY